MHRHLRKNTIKHEEQLGKSKKIMNDKYENLDDDQRAFYTIVLLLAEIEKQATENNLFIEKEVLQPGDEGYEEPKLESNEGLD